MGEGTTLFALLVGIFSLLYMIAALLVPVFIWRLWSDVREIRDAVVRRLTDTPSRK